MSPEQATPGNDVTIVSDVYGLGAVFYALLSGRPPFRGETVEDTLHQVRETKPVSPHDLNPAVDQTLARICLKCLEKDPAQRYPSAEELAADLETYLTGGWDPGHGPGGLWEWLWRQLQSPCRIDRPSEWAGVFRVVAAWRVICHVVMALLLQWGPAPVGYWVWFVGLHIGGTWLPVRVLRRSGRRLGSTERSVLLNWAATFACDALLLGIFCPPWGQAGPAEVVRVYPAWLAVRGLWYVMEAQRFWGRFYAVGFGFLAFTPFLSLCGLLAPMAYALVVACGMLLLSEGFRREATTHTLAASAGDRMNYSPPT
jgi:hypothetical protein